MSQEANRGRGGQRGRVQPRRPPIRRPMMDARQYRARYQLQRFQDRDDLEDLDMMVPRRPPSPIRPAVAREVRVEPDVIQLTVDDDILYATPSSPGSSHTPSTPSGVSIARSGPGESFSRPMQDDRDV